MHILSSKADMERKALRDMQDNQYSRYEQYVSPIITDNASAILKQYGSRLVCPHCAGIMAFTSRTSGYCPRCHYHGEAITVSQYLLKGMHK